MFRLGAPALRSRNLKHAFAERNLERSVQLGQYGVSFVPTPPDVEALKSRLADPTRSRASSPARLPGRRGCLETKSDLEALTQNALSPPTS